MNKLHKIIEAEEDWHIKRLSGISDDLTATAAIYEEMGPAYTSDMPVQINSIIERLSRLKEQITDDD